MDNIIIHDPLAGLHTITLPSGEQIPKSRTISHRLHKILVNIHTLLVSSQQAPWPELIAVHYFADMAPTALKVLSSIQRERDAGQLHRAGVQAISNMQRHRLRHLELSRADGLWVPLWYLPPCGHLITHLVVHSSDDTDAMQTLARGEDGYWSGWPVLQSLDIHAGPFWVIACEMQIRRLMANAASWRLTIDCVGDFPSIETFSVLDNASLTPGTLVIDVWHCAIPPAACIRHMQCIAIGHAPSETEMCPIPDSLVRLDVAAGGLKHSWNNKRFQEVYGLLLPSLGLANWGTGLKEINFVDMCGAPPTHALPITFNVVRIRMPRSFAPLENACKLRGIRLAFFRRDVYNDRLAGSLDYFSMH